MYGFVATPRGESRARQRREREQQQQPAEDKDGKRLGLKERVVQYVKRRLNPPRAEEEPESSPPCRHRPEPLSALARASRFSQHEIKLMYRGFKQECPSGMVDEEMFKNIFAQFFPLGDASLYAQLVFNTIKHKGTGRVNFEQFLEILSLVARGSLQEKLAWVFRLYDADGDGRISRQEMTRVAIAVYELLGAGVAPSYSSSAAAAREHVDKIFHLIDTDADGAVTPSELRAYVSRDPDILRSLFALDTVL